MKSAVRKIAIHILKHELFSKHNRKSIKPFNVNLVDIEHEVEKESTCSC